MGGVRWKWEKTFDARQFRGAQLFKSRLFLMIFGFICFFLFSDESEAYPATEPSGNANTDVLMLEIPSVTPNSDELYTAIRAQLATSNFRIHRLLIEKSAFDRGNTGKSASDLAVRHNVEMVFWIQLSPGSCLLSFYFKERGEKVFQRRMKLDSENLSGQYEVISNGVSSFIEETIFIAHKDTRPKTQSLPDSPAILATPAERRAAGKLEISLMYNGMLFSKREVSNGVRGSLGVLAGERILLNLAFAQNAVTGFENRRYRFTVSSRNLDAGVFVNLPVRSMQLRFGVSYEVQLRTFTMESRVADLLARRGKLHSIHGVSPSVQLVWPLAGNFLFNMGVGAMVCVNEHGYIISRIDGTRYDVVNPYTVKLTFHLGIIFQSK
jgi:hypothetical protein